MTPTKLDDPGLFLKLVGQKERKNSQSYPPLSQIPQGSSARSPAVAVSDPVSFSNAQKKSVLFGWPALFTPTFPAKLRGRVQVTFVNVSVTSKSVG